MSLFERLKQTSDEHGKKIPIWPFMVSLHRIQDGLNTVSDVISHFNLDTDDAVELGAYLTTVQVQIATDQTALISAGMPAKQSADIVRMITFWKLWMITSGIESGQYTEAEVRSEMGLP